MKRKWRRAWSRRAIRELRVEAAPPSKTSRFWFVRWARRPRLSARSGLSSASPLWSAAGARFSKAREIRDVLALLAALDQIPLDDVAVVGVLRSPLVGLSDEEIFRIGRDGWLAEFERWFTEKLRRKAEIRCSGSAACVGSG